LQTVQDKAIVTMAD